MLGATGVTASLYHVNMEELIRRVGVPRSSVFAAFGGKEELITELMIQLLHPDPDRPSGYSPSTTAAAREVIAQYGDRLRRPDGTRNPEGEYAVMREAVRVVLRHNADAMMDSTDWQTYMALSASVLSLPEGRRERVRQALRDSEEQFVDAMVEFYSSALGLLGRRLRRGIEWSHLVTAGAGIVEGVVSRRRIGAPVVDEIILAPGIDGEPVEWTLVALAYLAIIEGLTEPIPL
jgi:AcrR family transcriptional regulator